MKVNFRFNRQKYETTQKKPNFAPFKITFKLKLTKESLGVF